MAGVTYIYMVSIETTRRGRNLKRRCIGIKLHTRAGDGAVLPYVLFAFVPVASSAVRSCQIKCYAR
jgi:hypothetical protein